MVVPLAEPIRPLAKRGLPWTWRPRARGRVKPWTWCRLYHYDPGHAATAEQHRQFGPLFRLDHQTAQDPPALCPDGRTVLYVGDTLETVIGEVFGDTPDDARVCPNMRIALLEPARSIPLLDLHKRGGAMRIRALPSLGTGAYDYHLTQKWARAIYEDQPVPRHRIQGIRYTAAHSGGQSLALWNTDSAVSTVISNGFRQDFAVQEPQVWTRVLVAANNIEVNMNRISATDCNRCP